MVIYIRQTEENFFSSFFFILYLIDCLGSCLCNSSLQPISRHSASSCFLINNVCPFVYCYICMYIVSFLFCFSPFSVYIFFLCVCVCPVVLKFCIDLMRWLSCQQYHFSLDFKPRIKCYVLAHLLNKFGIKKSLFFL